MRTAIAPRHWCRCLQELSRWGERGRAHARPPCSHPLKTLWRAASIRQPTDGGNIAHAKHDVVMPTNAPDSSGPAAPRCPRCSQPMHLVRRTPRFGGLPDLYTFECKSCEMSHTEEGGPARRRDTDLLGLFRKQARECRRLATLAQDSEDRSFWLRLSEHWLKLAQRAGQRTS